MLEIMEAFMEQIVKQGEIQSAKQCYEHTKSFGNNTTLESSPRKTQNQEVPPTSQTEVMMNHPRMVQKRRWALHLGRVNHDKGWLGTYFRG